MTSLPMNFRAPRTDNLYLQSKIQPNSALGSPRPSLPPLKDNPNSRWMPQGRHHTLDHVASELEKCQASTWQPQRYGEVQICCNNPEPKCGVCKQGSTFIQDDVTSPLEVRHWPTEPRSLKESVSFVSVLYTLGDYLMVLLPILFLVLCILAAKLNGERTDGSQLGHDVEEAMRLGPTIFPMLFAAVAGRTTKMIARYLAERGAKLGTLELLVASQTVWGTFESQLLLRRLSVVGAHLLLLWTLSPLGGQASLRLLDISTSYTVSNHIVKYLSTGPTSVLGSEFNHGSVADSALNQIYVASLIAPQTTKIGPRDTWGNPKVPRFDVLSDPDEQGWMSVPSLSSVDNYTSLVGLPFIGLSQGSSSFTLETSYLNLECFPPHVFPLSIPQNASNSWKQYLGQVWNNYGTPFLYHLGTISEMYIDDYTTFFLDTNLPENNMARLSALEGKALTPIQSRDPLLNQTRLITFGSRIPSPSPAGQVMISQCAVTSMNIEAYMDCSSSSVCEITRMRKSLVDKRSSVLTPLDMSPLTENFFMRLPWAVTEPQSAVSTPTEIFINDSSISPFHINNGEGYQYVDLSKIQPELFSVRLSTVLNTYYQISLASLAFSGGLPTNLSSYPSAFNFSNPVIAFIAGTTTATSKISFQTYATNYLWLALLATCASVLVVVGVTGLTLKHLGHAPDMLGFVSSMTYNNPYLALPSGGGPLDGMERARVLKDVRVRIVDIEGNDNVGHVALASIDDKVKGLASGSIRPLERTRTYL